MNPIYVYISVTLGQILFRSHSQRGFYIFFSPGKERVYTELT